MDNAYFLLSNRDLTIERFHLCSWEFKDQSALIEFGCEIVADTITDVQTLELELYIPWLTKESNTEDLYPRLSDSANSKFIFNDSVINTQSFDGGNRKLGVIHTFQLRTPLCILPVRLKKEDDQKIISADIDLTAYNNHLAAGTNIYIRFSVTTTIEKLSTRKKGISRSTIIYDTKINERRNLPDPLVAALQTKKLCTIASCFCFNIVPNNYDLSFFDASSLVNVRTLEYNAFNYYLQDKRVRKDELMVVFNKKGKNQSFAFFNIFTKERIGAGQYALAVLINLVCGVLLFIPAYRKGIGAGIGTSKFWKLLPAEVYIALGIGCILFIYFAWPFLAAKFKTKKFRKISS